MFPDDDYDDFGHFNYPLHKNAFSPQITQKCQNLKFSMHPQYHDDTLTQKRDPQVYKYRNTKENYKVQNTQNMKI